MSTRRPNRSRDWTELSWSCYYFCTGYCVSVNVAVAVGLNSRCSICTSCFHRVFTLLCVSLYLLLYPHLLLICSCCCNHLTYCCFSIRSPFCVCYPTDLWPTPNPRWHQLCGSYNYFMAFTLRSERKAIGRHPKLFPSLIFSDCHTWLSLCRCPTPLPLSHPSSSPACRECPKGQIAGWKLKMAIWGKLKELRSVALSLGSEWRGNGTAHWASLFCFVHFWRVGLRCLKLKKKKVNTRVTGWMTEMMMAS